MAGMGTAEGVWGEGLLHLVLLSEMVHDGRWTSRSLE